MTAADYGSVVYPTGDTLYESVAEYKCNLGFNLTGGSQYRYCLEDTSWNGTEPVCVTQGRYRTATYTVLNISK